MRHSSLMRSGMARANEPFYLYSSPQPQSITVLWPVLVSRHAKGECWVATPNAVTILRQMPNRHVVRDFLLFLLLRLLRQIRYFPVDPAVYLTLSLSDFLRINVIFLILQLLHAFCLDSIICFDFSNSNSLSQTLKLAYSHTALRQSKNPPLM